LHNPFDQLQIRRSAQRIGGIAGGVPCT